MMTEFDEYFRRFSDGKHKLLLSHEMILSVMVKDLTNAVLELISVLKKEKNRT